MCVCSLFFDTTDNITLQSSFRGQMFDIHLKNTNADLTAGEAQMHLLNTIYHQVLPTNASFVGV